MIAVRVAAALFVVGWVSAAGAESKLTYDSAAGKARLRVTVIEAGLPEGVAPEPLLESAKVQAKAKHRFGWFSFGDGHSRSIAVLHALDEPTVLFVDLNRDKQFSKRERLVAEDGTWQTKISAEFVVGQNGYLYQDVETRIRWNDVTKRFELFAPGCMTGVAVLDGKERAAKLVDMNSNGNWFDPEDRFLVDVDGDGKVNPITERYSCSSICNIDGRQFAVAGSRMGRSLVLRPITDRAKIVPVLTLDDENAEVLELKAVVASKSGIHLRISKLDEPIECPVGSYYVAALDMKLKTAKGVYSFRFAGMGSDQDGVELATNAEGEIELLGELKLGSTESVSRDGTRSTLSIIPTMTTSSGLYLVLSRRGTTAAVADNRLISRSVFGGKREVVGSSGFS